MMMDTVDEVEAPTTGARLLDLARREIGLTSMVVMALAGLAIAGYLTAVHYAKAPLACPTHGIINCQAVTSSAFSVVPGTALPITLPGILWFIVSGAMALVALARIWAGRPEVERLRLVQVLWGAAGVMFVLYLVYAEIVSLHMTFCEWCTVVHLLTLATFLVALKRWQDGQLTVARTKSAHYQARGLRSNASGSTRKPSPSAASNQSNGRRRAGSSAR